MKKNILVIILLLLSVNVASLAQVTISAEDIPNRPGKVHVFMNYWDPNEGIEVNIGEPGRDQRWDYSSFAYQDRVPDSLYDPATAPDRGRFQHSNRVIRTETNALGLRVGGGLQYEMLADSGHYILGANSSMIDGVTFDSVLIFPEPIPVLRFPAEVGDEWDINVDFEVGFPAPDTLLGGNVDSVFIRYEIAGTSTVDADGILVFPFRRGETSVIRQHLQVSGTISIFAVMWVFNQRIVVDLPYGYEMEPTHTYRWISPEKGEVARIISLPGEENPNFNRASEIRIRRTASAIDFRDPLVDFGVVNVGEARIAEVRMLNNGDGTGTIRNVAISNGLDAEIALSNALPLTILPDSSATLIFRWVPNREKSLWPGYVSIGHSDSSYGYTQRINLQGATPEFQSVGSGENLPDQFRIISFAPNPFNNYGELKFNLPTSSGVSINLFDANGRLVKKVLESEMPSGEHGIVVDGYGLAAGTYLLKIASDFGTVSQRITLQK